MLPNVLKTWMSIVSDKNWVEPSAMVKKRAMTVPAARFFEVGRIGTATTIAACGKVSGHAADRPTVSACLHISSSVKPLQLTNHDGMSSAIRDIRESTAALDAEDAAAWLLTLRWS